ncbi:unnamed protein product [Adineta steineri]|uniref:V-SNARE coiled-coil homology domain-containing protein n=1 Tax=Adineta steineri TaxID=433720 RepID=A0A814I095_9BILA|nr:unnamed protein product [Adineta steineri]CAF1017004.1 unnamed protein product [Adineta steineri]
MTIRPIWRCCLQASSFENPPRANQYQSSKKFDNLQADVNQVVDVMKDNLDKVLERDAKLTTLENRADALQTGASQFTTNAGKLKRKYWWKNLKMWIILIIVIVNRFNSCHSWTTNNSGVPPAAGGGGSKRLAQQQAQVDEVVDIMRQNVDKVLERDKNLSLLDDRADKLQHNAAQFEQHAGKLKRKYWWKNMKMMIIMGVVGTIFTIVVIAWIASKVKAVAPVLPSGDETAAIPSVNNPVVPVSGGSMAIPNEVKSTTTRRPRGSRKKTTLSASVTGPVVVSSKEDGEPEQSNGEDATRLAIKRVARALFDRQ